MAAYEECPATEYTGIALEFGTLPLTEVFGALRADHWLHNHPEAPAQHRAAVNSAMRRAFYDETPQWQIAVVGQARPKEGASEELLIEGALFESGRPVVVVPYVQARGLRLGRVLVCWDGSRPATRAIADALPFLQRAKAIEIVAVSGERGKDRELVGTNMARHLARHGLAVELKRLVKIRNRCRIIQFHIVQIAAPGIGFSVRWLLLNSRCAVG